MFQKLGEELKNEREKKGATLQQIAARTRINIKFLEFLEAGDFKKFKEEAFVKAFIKEYCESIDLDAVVYLKKYEIAKLGYVPEHDAEKKKIDIDEKPGHKIEHPMEETPVLKSEQAQTIRTEYSDEPRKSSEKIKTPQSNMIYSVAAVILLAIGALIYFIFIKEESAKLVKERPYEEILLEKSRYKEKPISEIKKNVETRDSLFLTITSRDSAWVQVFMDGAKSTHFILAPRAKRRFRAKENFTLNFGNCRSIELFLNDEKIDFIQKRGAANNIIVDAEGVHYPDNYQTLPPTTRAPQIQRNQSATTTAEPR